MTEASFTVRRATEAELDQVEALLDANDLPSADVRAKPDCFFVADAGADVVGVGGVEIHGTHGLLRSVAVAASDRGRGYGSAICDELENHARREEVETLFLLTTTAASFFRERGFAEIARDEAPTSIQHTTQFVDLCPASATCVGKDLR